MSRLATPRLIDASAALDAVDRALVNLWVNRGLDGDASFPTPTSPVPPAVRGHYEV